jgi:hypothetical protein
MVVALGVPTALIGNTRRLLTLPVTLPVSPKIVIFETAGASSGEFIASVSVIVFICPGLLVDWPMLKLKKDRACTSSGVASPTFSSIQSAVLQRVQCIYSDTILTT